MRKEERHISYHSEPVQEIMGTIPSWITRWGVTIIFSILLLVLVGCCIIRYPETVTGTVELVSSNPPADLVARQSGLIDELFVHNGDIIGDGDMVAVITSSSNIEDVLAVTSFLDGKDKWTLDMAIGNDLFEKDLQLGELQLQWIDVCGVVKEYSDYIHLAHHDARKRQLLEQKNELLRQQTLLHRQNAVLLEDLRVQESALKRDSVLYGLNAITLVEYESSRQAYLSKLSSLRSSESSIQGTQITLVQLEGELQEIDIEDNEQSQGYMRRYSQAVTSMESAMASWRESYALVSPCAGTVSMPAFWNNGQYVSVGETVASIVPLVSKECTGRARIESSGIGKVKVGQDVRVQLNGFPYMEYGILRGVVTDVSPVPERLQDGSISYTLEIQFPEGLVTTYGKGLPFIQGMDGTAEIIAEERMLIMAFLEPLKSIFVNR